VMGYGGMINVPAIDMISQEINLVGTCNNLDAPNHKATSRRSQR